MTTEIGDNTGVSFPGERSCTSYFHCESTEGRKRLLLKRCCNWWTCMAGIVTYKYAEAS